MDIDLADVVRLTCQAEEGNPVAKFVLAFLTGEREVVRGPSGDYWYPTSREELLAMRATTAAVTYGDGVYVAMAEEGSMWAWLRWAAIDGRRPQGVFEVQAYEYVNGSYRSTGEVWG